MPLAMVPACALPLLPVQLVPALALALICAATAAGRDRAAAASLRAAPIDIFGAAETTQLLQTTTTRDTVMAPHARLRGGIFF